jgi:hypothetical protein
MAVNGRLSQTRAAGDARAQAGSRLLVPFSMLEVSREVEVAATGTCPAFPQVDPAVPRAAHVCKSVYSHAFASRALIYQAWTETKGFAEFSCSKALHPVIILSHPLS